MVSELARGDYEDLQANGLKPTLDDFDRLNRLALRLTDGAETTAANFPRIGWAGDIPFFQPTCAAFAWYFEFVERASFDPATKNACWFYALAHAREKGAFEDICTPERIDRTVSRWLSILPATRDEVARACRFAATGFDDAQPGKTDKQHEADAAKTAADRREESLANLHDAVTTAVAFTGIPPDDLMRETPSRLKKMVEAVRDLHSLSGSRESEHRRLMADYDLALREIRRRLTSDKESPNGQQ